MQPQSIYQYFLLIGLWLFTSSSFANSSILLSNESFEYSITPYLSVYEDSSQQLTIDEVSSLDYSVLFTPIHANMIKFGISDSFFWFRFSLTNPYNKPVRTIFSLSDGDFDQINFYLLKADNTHQHYSNEHFERAVKGGFLQKHTLQIHVPANTTHTYLLQVHSEGLITALASVQSIDKYILKEQKFFSLLGLSFGLLLGCALFFVYLWFAYRLAIAAPALILIPLLILYQITGLDYLEIITGISAFAADKISEMTLGLIGSVQMSIMLSLSWPKHQKMIRSLVLTAALSIIPLTLAILLFMPVAAMPIIAALVLLINMVAVFILLFSTSTNVISQRWLRAGHLTTAIGILVILLTNFNLLSFDTFSIWSRLSVPLAVITFIVAAALAQVPRTKLAGQNQASGNPLPLQHILLTKISEELRTPANSVLGISDLLENTPLSAHQRELNSSLSETGHDFLHAINQINDIGYLYSGEIDLIKKPVNLLELVNRSLSDLQPEATRRKVELILDYCEDLPRFINSDPDRLYIIIHNILKRALTYTEYGEINVSVKPFQAQQGFGILFQVQLSSTIIRPDELKNSFSVLQHQDSLPNNGKYEWYLLLTRFLIKKMNARLEVESMTVEGASLSLTFSFPKESIPDQPALASGILSGRQLLIVDDNASLRSVLEKQIRRWGLYVDSTYNSKEALAMMRSHINLDKPYDFLILDQDMPILNGIEIAKLIQQDQSIQPKPAIVMLASRNVNDLREEAYNAGIAIVLAKPAYPEHLQQALQDLLPASQKTHRGK